ncbi:hypothetical protein [Silvibacterium sp.]|uniref:hypothetical protein n=1 Tax=Silvibacterium sp. TaxID=1964179 RepID=UPI0039E53F23
MGIYREVSINEIVEQLEHIRQLHRGVHPSSERARIIHDKREQKIKDFLSNIRRTGVRAMVPMVHELEELCGLTTGSGYRLLGYELDAIREYDHVLNAGRTHIVESHIFERDIRIELPLELAENPAIDADCTLQNFVRSWQRDVPLRALDGSTWRHRNVFYVHVGTEDSLGSCLPAGSMAQVELIGKEEVLQPVPNTIYLIQLRNGYRFSRCVATLGRIQLLLSLEGCFDKEEIYPYPSDALRIVGKVLSFALNLPLPEYRAIRAIQQYSGTAAMLLPWEHRTRGSYLATKHRRFIRPDEEAEFLAKVLASKLPKLASERSKRRLRSDNRSEPHVDGLIQTTLESYARFSDSLRLSGYLSKDANLFSLETFLQARNYADLMTLKMGARPPFPESAWKMMRAELVDLTPLLLLKFPRLSRVEDRIIRVSQKSELPALNPAVNAGSWMLLENVSIAPDVQGDALKLGWHRPLYALRRGLTTLWGYLEREGASFVFLQRDQNSVIPIRLGAADLTQLQRVCGAVVRVS